MNNKRFTIFQGNALDVLRTIPNESVDCVISSPPYWGLRDYGTQPIIWDGDNDCEHDFYSRKTTLLHENRNFKNGGNDDVSGDIVHIFKNSKIETGFCRKCGAWKGELGLEPTPELYVSHITDIFMEVYRILKPQGSVWLNIGDSYVSGKSRYSSNTQTISGKYRDEPDKGNKPDIRHHPVLKDKDIAGIPWRVAFSLQASGYYLRQDIVWHKPNPMPESVNDRCTKAHEYIFFLTKNPTYYFDQNAILEPANYDGRKDTLFKGSKKYQDEMFLPDGVSENSFFSRGRERWSRRIDRSEESFYTRRKMEKTGYGGDGKCLHGHSGYFDADGKLRAHKTDDGILARNKRSVWMVPTKPFKDAHFATFPEKLIEPMVLAGCQNNGIILDPFSGSGTTGVVALKNNRRFIGIELNPEYIIMAEKRIALADSQLTFSRMPN